MKVKNFIPLALMTLVLSSCFASGNSSTKISSLNQSSTVESLVSAPLMTEFEQAFALNQVSSFTANLSQKAIIDGVNQDLLYNIIFQENRFFLGMEEMEDDFYIEIVDNQYHAYAKVDDEPFHRATSSLGDMFDESGIFRFDNLANFKESDFIKEETWYINDLLEKDSVETYLDPGVNRPDPNIAGSSLKVRVKITNNILDVIEFEMLTPTRLWTSFILTFTFTKLGNSVVTEPLWITEYKNTIH